MRLNDAERINLAEEYRRAANEHFAELQRLTLDGVFHFSLAFYLAGVAVECLFRAYIALVDAPFDDKHDLRQLAVSGRFMEFMSQREAEQERLQAAITSVFMRWSNGFRYSSTSGLRKKLIQKGLHRNGRQHLRGEILKENWEILFLATDILMTAGIEKWEPSKKKWNV